MEISPSVAIAVPYRAHRVG